MNINNLNPARISDALNTIVNQYIVTPLGGRSSSGINGFVFDVVDNEEVTLRSEVTDHYVEDNYAIQDHIALPPVEVTLRGYVGEVSQLLPNLTGLFSSTLNSLQLITDFIPGFSTQATAVYGKIAGKVSQGLNYLNKAQNIFDLFTGKSTAVTKQQKAYQIFFSMWKARLLCSVETPYQKFDNMAITRVSMRQTGESRLVSDIVVSFKQIQTATVKTVSSALSARAADYKSAIVQNGSTGGLATDAAGSLYNADNLSTLLPL